MRGYFKAALLLAPALASAFTIPDFWADINHEDNKESKPDDAASKTIRLMPDGASHDDVTADVLSFHINVLPSIQICGVGNVTMNGQELEQASRGDGSSGKGSITDDKKIISATWDFNCLKGHKDEPSAQFMRFAIESIDGKDVEDLAFSIVFRQAPFPEIVMTSPDLPLELPFQEAHSFPNMSDEDEDGEEGRLDFESYDLKSEVAELHMMQDLVQELQYRIYEKEQEIAAVLAAQEFDSSIGECDSLKCLVKACVSKARKLAHRVKNKVASLAGAEEDGVGGHWKRPHWKKPHWKKPHLPKHGNHSHHNKTCHRPHHNGSHPHPPHKKHHFMLPPKFCHKFCHPHPPHHKKPHHGKPPHHGGPPFDGPQPHDGVPHDNHKIDHPDQHQSLDNRPLTFEDDAPPPHNKDGGPPLPSRHRGEGPKHGHRRPHWFKTLHILQIVIAGLIFTLIFAAVRRRCCNSSRRAEKRSRREERHRRRAYRRAARKAAWKSWIARHFYYRFQEEDYEEKYGSFAPSDGENEDMDDVGSTIAELQSAVGVVSDIVAAEEGRGRVSMESRATTLPEYREGEDLPAYEEDDGSEDSSMVADGFRYTPGSSEYTPGSGSPSVSEAGNVRSVLGDTKD